MLEKIEKSIFLSKPIIGIVSRKIDNYYKVNESLLNAVTLCGGIPICILPSCNLEEVLDICDGILMPGGNTIYQYDVDICDYAIKNNKPLLGICLGMQIMACHKIDSLVINETYFFIFNSHSINFIFVFFYIIR